MEGALHEEIRGHYESQKINTNTMKTQSKSNERLLSALQAIKMMIDQTGTVSFDKIYTLFKISRSTQTSLKRLGIISSNARMQYEWIGEMPSIELCEKVKKYHAELYRKETDESEPIELEFDVKTVDEKLNHINFMLDQLFDRVEYIFDQLADKSAKDKRSAEWFYQK